MRRLTSFGLLLNKMQLNVASRPINARNGTLASLSLKAEKTPQDHRLGVAFFKS